MTVELAPAAVKTLAEVMAVSLNRHSLSLSLSLSLSVCR
jgi:hypothetical protein